MDVFKLVGSIFIKNDEANENIDETTGKAKSASEKIGKAFGAVAKGVGVAVTAGATAVTALSTKAISAYADYEQLIGGVETLFGKSADKVMDYANKAFQTAGLSANEYMETVTSFSASLLQGLGGDTEKASEVANLAITDMSDNANKMGTSMESIQNAYQGFAKQNYTMLDNLKLGYGGTQEEMVRLINDSGVLNEKIKSMDGISFDTIISAIHKVQDNMGITGTTAKEASTTISGSIASLKSAWENTLVGLGNDTGDFTAVIEQLVDSAMTVFSNILPRIKVIFEAIPKLVNQILPQIPVIIESLLPPLLQATINLLNGLVASFPQLMDVLLGMLPMLIDGLVQFTEAIIDALPSLVEEVVKALPTLFPMLIEGVSKLIISLADNLVDIIDPIIESMPLIIEAVVFALVANVPLLIDAGIQLIAGLLDGMLSLIGDIPTILKAIWDGLVEGIKKLFGIHSPSTVMRDIGINIMEGLFNGIESLLGKIGDLWNTLKNITSDAFENVKNVVKNAIDKVRSFFDFEWSLPKLKMPHFTISGKFSLNPLSVPKLGIEWYKDGGVMLDPTIFGFNGNKAMVGGEAGAEAIAPIDILLGYIRTAVAEQNASLIQCLKDSIDDLGSKLSDKTEGDIVIPVYIGETMIDDIIVNSKKNVRLRSGGLTSV